MVPRKRRFPLLPFLAAARPFESKRLARLPYCKFLRGEAYCVPSFCCGRLPSVGLPVCPAKPRNQATPASQGLAPRDDNESEDERRPRQKKQYKAKSKNTQSRARSSRYANASSQSIYSVTRFSTIIHRFRIPRQDAFCPRRRRPQRWSGGSIIAFLLLTDAVAPLAAHTSCCCFVSTSARNRELKRLTTSTASSSRGSSTPTKMASSGSQSPKSSYSFIDMGANLLEDRFTKGVYRGTFRHEPDLDLIMRRAMDIGVKRIILTAGTVEESRAAVVRAREWNRQYDGLQFHSTVGVHPTRCKQVFENIATDDGGGASNPEQNQHVERETADDLLQQLLDIAKDGMADGTVAAIGEIGLDYDRLQFCPKDIQRKYLIRQLQELAKTTGLPLFLHNRSVGTDLLDILTEHSDCWKNGGVVHSFDDELKLATQFMELGLYIGLNGCSLRTPSNLQVARDIPLGRILLETDCPYCEVRSTHAGFSHIVTKFEAKAEKKFERGKLVKSRQEPCHIIQVAEVLAGCKELPVKQVADTCYENTLQLFQMRSR